MSKNKKKKIISDKAIFRKVKYFRFIMPLLDKSIRGPKKLSGTEQIYKTDEGNIRVLTYNMDNNTVLPLFINIHGSGFTVGHAEMDDPFMERLAKQLSIKIISIDYSLSPENKYPKALDECYSVVKYAIENSVQLGINPQKIALGGHSAGANLSTGVCLINANEKKFDLKCLILDYPPLDLFTDPFLKPLPKEAIPPKVARVFNAAYCTEEQAKTPLVSPLFSQVEQLKTFPPTLMITAGLDSLCREGEEFKDKLKSAGVKVEYYCFQNSPHAFTHQKSKEADDAWQLMADYIKKNIC